jgi:hypothetical protein
MKKAGPASSRPRFFLLLNYTIAAPDDALGSNVVQLQLNTTSA